MIRILLGITLVSAPLVAQELTPQNMKFDPGNHRVWVQVGDFKREYLVHVPEAYDSYGPAPLLLTYHGSGGTLDDMYRVTAWATQSEEKKYLAVYLNGFPDDQGMRVWNDGRRREGTDSTVDDVAFTRTVIADVSSRLRVDRKRIHVVGFSNGAGMAYRLAVEIGDQIASIAPVAGRINVPVEKLARAVPALAIVGTRDPGFQSDTRAVERWAGMVGCSAPRDTSRNGRYISVAFQNCPSKADVISYTVQDWEHYWPGGTNPGIQGWAEGIIWKFFEKHPLRSSEEGGGKREE